MYFHKSQKGASIEHDGGTRIYTYLREMDMLKFCLGLLDLENPKKGIALLWEIFQKMIFFMFLAGKVSRWILEGQSLCPIPLRLSQCGHYVGMDGFNFWFTYPRFYVFSKVSSHSVHLTPSLSYHLV